MERDEGVGGDGALYRVVVDGRVGERWTDWFEADRVVPAGGSTVIEVRARDQSELYGRLRRIHDLNLRLVSVVRVAGPPGPAPDRD